MESINWKAKGAIARKMTKAQLKFAIKDCHEAAKALGTGPQIGKDDNYYMDELSIYHQELEGRCQMCEKLGGFRKIDGKIHCLCRKHTADLMGAK